MSAGQLRQDLRGADSACTVGIKRSGTLLASCWQ